jgi:L-lactate utilization protein LutC
MSRNDSQAAFLARVHAALARAPRWNTRAPVTLQAPSIPNDARVDQFERALSAVGGKVHRPADDTGACDEIVSIARDHAVRHVAWIASPALDGWGLREALIGSGVKVRSVDFPEWVRQEGEEDRARRALREFLASADMTVGGADYAIAETGTLVLLAGVANPRSATNLPPLHLAVIRPGQIVSTLFDLTPRLREDAARASCITFITGPSRTSDIEQISTIGVHGPIELHVMIRP